MLRFLFMLILFGVVPLSYGQTVHWSKARKLLDARQYDAAMKTMDSVMQGDIWKHKADAWLCRADVSFAYFRNSENASASIDGFQNAVDYYRKALELDNGSLEKKIRDQLQINSVLLLNDGVALYNGSVYEPAYDLFRICISIADILDQTDTLAMYNCALASDAAGLTKDAIQWYDKCEALGYKGATCCNMSVSLYAKLNDAEGYRKRLISCRDRYPDDQNLLHTEINYMLRSEKYSDAIPLLEKAISKSPGDAPMHFLLSTCYDRTAQFEKAERSYQETIALDADYFDAYYNLGALYFNKGVEKNGELNASLPPETYLKIKAETENYLKMAIRPLEQARAIKPDDVGLLESLLQLYSFLGDEEKAAIIQEQLNNGK